MSGYFWPHVFATDGADKYLPEGPFKTSDLKSSLSMTFQRLEALGVKDANHLIIVPVGWVHIVAVVADFLSDTGIANDATFISAKEKFGELHLKIIATPDDQAAIDEACSWARRASKKTCMMTGAPGKLRTTTPCVVTLSDEAEEAMHVLGPEMFRVRTFI